MNPATMNICRPSPTAPLMMTLKKYKKDRMNNGAISGNALPIAVASANGIWKIMPAAHTKDTPPRELPLVNAMSPTNASSIQVISVFVCIRSFGSLHHRYARRHRPWLRLRCHGPGGCLSMHGIDGGERTIYTLLLLSSNIFAGRVTIPGTPAVQQKPRPFPLARVLMPPIDYCRGPSLPKQSLRARPALIPKWPNFWTRSISSPRSSSFS